MLIIFSFSVDQLNYIFKVQKFIHPFSHDWIAEYLYACIHVIRQKCKQYILKWDAVGSLLKQTKGINNKNMHQILDKNVDKKSPVIRPNLYTTVKPSHRSSACIFPLTVSQGK
jgi:hypothetical protein